MKFDPSLQQGILIKRYKRFLADVALPDGSVITIHCPNTGSMKNCSQAGSRVWFSDSANAKRKYPNTWEMVEVADGVIAGVNTGRANGLVKEAIEKGTVPELAGYTTLRSEVKYGDEKSRIDLLLEYPDGRCYIEVKNTTLSEGGIGFFPDSVTQRGQKHLRELMAMVEQGHRAVLFFCVQHTGVDSVRPADHIDAEYGRLLRQAHKLGVEVMAWQCDMSDKEVVITRALPVEL